MSAAARLAVPGAPAEEASPATRILLVEDEPDQREVAAELLRTEGFEVAAVQDGLDAVLYLRTSAVLPQVVLLDLEMPVMDGREFRAWQLGDPSARSVPVVILSSSPPGGVEAAAYLAKPCDAEELVAVLRRVAQH